PTLLAGVRFNAHEVAKLAEHKHQIAVDGRCAARPRVIDPGLADFGGPNLLPIRFVERVDEARLSGVTHGENPRSEEHTSELQSPLHDALPICQRSLPVSASTHTRSPNWPSTNTKLPSTAGVQRGPG